jgi:hypothetical protein
LTTFLLFDNFCHTRRGAEESVEKRDSKKTAAKKWREERGIVVTGGKGCVEALRQKDAQKPKLPMGDAALRGCPIDSDFQF